MKFLSALLLLSLSLSGATLRLRYGGTASSYRITSITNATPAVVSVVNRDNQPVHDLVAGDTIYVQAMQGCQEAVGYQTVAASPAPTTATFALNGVTCSVPFDTSFEAGWVGKYHVVTLNTHPRLMAPQSGPLHDRIIDPDGAGPGVAGMVTENGKAWQGMVARFTSTSNPYTTPGCDGITKSLCPNEEASIYYQPRNGWDVLGLAIMWQADNSYSAIGTAARYQLNHVEQLMWQTPVPGFPCDNSADACGVGSYADWGAGTIALIAKAYDIIYPQMSSDERTRFQNAVLNGWNGVGCDNQLVQQAGTVNFSASTITGTGFTGVYAAGDTIYLKTVAAWGSAGKWETITAATDTTLTVTPATASVFTAVNHYKALAWSSGSCGAIYGIGGHSSFQGTVNQYGYTKLSAAIDSVTTTIPVITTTNFLDAAPFTVYIGSEALACSAKSATSLTCTRGQDYSTAAAHAINVAVTWPRHKMGEINSTTGPFAVAGNYTHNLVNQKETGNLMSGLALAGDDARGTALAEEAFNSFYDGTFAWMEDMWSGTDAGGSNDWGYAWGRWNMNAINIILAAQYTFSDATYPEMIADYFWRGMMQPVYWSNPGTAFTRGPAVTNSGETYLTKKGSMAWFPLGTTFFPGDLANWAAYWYRNYGFATSYTGTTGIESAVFIAPYYYESATGADWTSVADPWQFNTTSTFGSDRAQSYLFSRSDWTTSASFVMAALGFYEIKDHNVDQSIATVPGSYLVEKGAKVMFGGNNPAGMGSGTAANLPWFSVTSTAGKNLKTTGYPWWVSSTLAFGGGNGPNAVLDRQKGTSTYVYARGNFSTAFQSSVGLSRGLRSITHLKSTAEYVVVFDDYAASHTNANITNLFYPTVDDAAYTYAFSSNVVTVTKPTAPTAIINTKLLFPLASPTITQSTATYARKLALDFGSTAAAQMLAVHRVATGTTDTMPATTLVTSDATSIGVQIDDSGDSWILVYANDGVDRSTRSATATHSGNGKVLFTGLLAGTYTVASDGTPLVTGQVVGADGTLLATANGAHVFSAALDGAGGVLTVNPSNLSFSCPVGGGAQPSQAVAIGAAGVTLDNWSAAKTQAWLSLSPTSGSAAGPMGVVATCTGLAVGPYSDTITVSSTTVGISAPVTVPVSLTVVPVPSIGTVLNNMTIRNTKVGQ